MAFCVGRPNVGETVIEIELRTAARVGRGSGLTGVVGPRSIRTKRRVRLSGSYM